MTTKYVWFTGFGLLVLGLDQFGKRAAERSLAVGERESLVDALVSLVHEPTVGGALGLIRDGSPELQLLVHGLLSAVAIVIALSFLRALAPRDLVTAAALGAVLGGVISNALDRLRLGATLDFLRFGAGESGLLPAFNLADAAIVLGVGTLIIELLANEMAARAAERPRRPPTH